MFLYSNRKDNNLFKIIFKFSWSRTSIS